MAETTATIARYESYKDSDVEWLGEIPEHWETTKIKFFFKNKNSIFIDGDWIESKDIGSDEVYYFTTGNIRELKFYDKERTFISNQTFDKLNCTEIYENDILISRLNLPIGRCCLAPKFDKKTIVSVDVCVLRADRDYDRSFLVYVMNSPQYFSHTENEARGAIMKRISRTILGNISLPIPPLQEQTKIAQFLDDKTTKIDEAIAIKQQQINLLKERKQILIHKAVTRGLDDKVALKDSGVEWIGEIPEHWEVNKLFGLADFVRGNTPFSKDELLNKGNYVALQYGKTYKVDKIDENYSFYINDEFYKDSQIVSYGTTILISTSETIEDLGHSAFYSRNDLGLLGGEQMMLHPKKNELDGHFLFFLSKIFSKELRKYATGIKVFRFNINDLKTIYIPLPPLSEQKEIAQYIEIASAKIETAMSLKEQEISKLQEYKSSLINSVVTGKVKVC